jgi:hypothetical protein
MAGNIGIKIANGDFYPILTEGKSTVKKRLVLTTVHDRQKSVQIDLYRSASKSILDAQYIGSLVVESIKPRPRGEASIEMVISCDADGVIAADACDLDAGPGGGHQVLNVSLKTTDINGKSADFNLNSKSNILTSHLYEQSPGEEEDKRKFPWIIMAAATIFVILVIALLWFFFLGGRDMPLFAGSQKSEQPAPYTPPPPAPVATPAPEPAPPPPAAPPPPVEETPVIAAPVSPPPARPAVQRTRPPAPVSSYKVPAVIPKEGVAYRIRWGDTLWDISEAFYRNPWLYPRIARHNNIRNPDLIISGRTIRIPPRN